MNWGLTQGILGRKRESLAPSASAIGPNTYLTVRDFLVMLGVAFGVHVLVFVIAALMPTTKVTDIPVRALSFKLGDEHRMAASSAPAVNAPSTPAPVLEAVSADSWQATPNVPAPLVPAPLAAPVIAKPVPKPLVKPAPVKLPPVVKPVAPPAIAPAPQQYVREVGAAPAQGAFARVGQGNATSMAEQSAQAVRARYEQQISAWIQQHKLYPTSAGGREGRVVVRMRIDRAGNVRYYAIEQSAGLALFDEAALDMIRRANPVPAVPSNYPASSLVEFLIPISFKAPL